MLALFFEVCPKPGAMQRYLDMAAALKPALEQSGGCLFIDRFRNLDREGWLLSYQIWRDEAAMTHWRVNRQHHGAQTCGRHEIFSDYRLRVAQVVREEKPDTQPWQPARLSAYNDTASRPPRFMAVMESSSVESGQTSGIAREAYESLYRPGRFAHVFTVPGLPAALELSKSSPSSCPLEYFRICEIERDYGMFQRDEAPQYYEEVQRTTF